MIGIKSLKPKLYLQFQLETETLPKGFVTFADWLKLKEYDRATIQILTQVPDGTAKEMV